MAEIPVPSGYGVPLVDMVTKRLPEPTMTVISEEIEAAVASQASPTLSNPTLTGTVTVPDGALAIADTSGLQTALDAETTRATASAATFSLIFGG